MTTWLRQSTAVEIKVGPFVDSLDAKTAETGLTIAQADVLLAKNGGDFAQKNEATTLVHESNGWYRCLLDATDTDTLGILTLQIDEAGALAVWEKFMVLPAGIYDALVSAGTLTLPAGIVVTNSTLNQPGVSITGNGTGGGMLVTAGSNGGHGVSIIGNGTGHGLFCNSGSGATSDGIRAVANSTNGNGIAALGSGTADGAMFTGGATGRGIHAVGGASSGAGFRAEGTAGNSNAMELAGQGSAHGLSATGGATGNGLRLIGGGTSGDALLTSATSGHGATFAGTGTTKHGINATGGATTSHGINATGGGVGHGILATSGGGATGDGIRATAASTNGNGFNLVGVGTGAGMLATGGATGNGFKIVGGGTSGAGVLVNTTSGDGINVSPTAGHGVNLAANGSSKHGLFTTGGGAGTSHGVSAVAGSSGHPISGGVDITRINDNDTAAARLAQMFGAAQLITVDDATFTPTTTAFETDQTADEEGEYTSQVLFCATGANAGVTVKISAYDFTNSKVKLTVDALRVAPADGDTFIKMGRGVT